MMISSQLSVAMTNRSLLQAKLDSCNHLDVSEVGPEELASMFRLTVQRIIQLTKEGLPRTARGSYPLRESVVFYVEYLRARIQENQSETIIAERLRLVRAKASKAEIEAEKYRDRVLSIDEARSQVMAICQELKENLLGVPGRVAHSLVGLGESEIYAILDREIKNGIANAASKLEAIAGSASVGDENIARGSQRQSAD